MGSLGITPFDLQGAFLPMCSLGGLLTPSNKYVAWAGPSLLFQLPFYSH